MVRNLKKKKQKHDCEEWLRCLVITVKKSISHPLALLQNQGLKEIRQRIYHLRINWLVRQIWKNCRGCSRTKMRKLSLLLLRRRWRWTWTRLRLSLPPTRSTHCRKGTYDSKKSKPNRLLHLFTLTHKIKRVQRPEELRQPKNLSHSFWPKRWLKVRIQGLLRSCNLPGVKMNLCNKLSNLKSKSSGDKRKNKWGN